MANKHIRSFKLAFSGIWYALRTQLNFIVHILAALLAVTLGFIFKLESLEWVVLVMTIVMVFVAEMINTSIESMTNLILEEHHNLAKIAKDVSAGMVLTAVIGAVIIGMIIFIPKL